MKYYSDPLQSNQSPHKSPLLNLISIEYLSIQGRELCTHDSVQIVDTFMWRYSLYRIPKDMPKAANERQSQTCQCHANEVIFVEIQTCSE